MEQVKKTLEVGGAQVVLTYDVIDGGVSEVAVLATLDNGSEKATLGRHYWRDGSHAPSGNSIIFDDDALWEAVNEVFTEYPDVQPLAIEE